ncbi:hypothetical protein [Parabacteroides sp. PF5-9]|uniref:hypothetical protein n=1 Tax=Parabacteroides sp. PF5-9 TaxID=1742404 RepID=UPI0024752FC0|nr:hypothetical protein [Parabacteroides sp. PF5-9]MDH6357015.1 hypothetical protein [Parabacteroides sp. PF5-9]
MTFPLKSVAKIWLFWLTPNDIEKKMDKKMMRVGRKRLLCIGEMDKMPVNQGGVGLLELLMTIILKIQRIEFCVKIGVIYPAIIYSCSLIVLFDASIMQKEKREC